MGCSYILQYQMDRLQPSTWLLERNDSDRYDDRLLVNVHA
jgi:hypothetical protein